MLWGMNPMLRDWNSVLRDTNSTIQGMNCVLRATNSMLQRTNSTLRDTSFSGSDLRKICFGSFFVDLSHSLFGDQERFCIDPEP